MNPKFLSADIIVLGGGPAGCAAALSAKAAGAQSVLVIERSFEGTHRIGEIFLTQTILELKRLGVAKDIYEASVRFGWQRKLGAAYVHGADRAPWKVLNNHPLIIDELRNEFPPEFVDPENNLTFTLMLRRHEFDQALREATRAKGVDFHEGFVTSFKHAGAPIGGQSSILSVEGKSKNGEEFSCSAKHFIDATGQRAFFARGMGERLALENHKLQSRYCYLKGVDWEAPEKVGFGRKFTNILAFEDGWSWVASLGEGMTSFGIVSKNWDKPLHAKMLALPEAGLFGLDKASVCDHVGNPEKETFFYAHPDFRYRSSVLFGKNWVSAGDAAMFLDPLLSQGVTLALAFGAKAGQAAALIIQGKQSLEAHWHYEKAYVREIEVLNKVVSLWYQPSFSFADDWAAAAGRLKKVFGREIGDDVDSFRWISNLENIHLVFNDWDMKGFLTQIDTVSAIEALHQFEEAEKTVSLSAPSSASAQFEEIRSESGA